jgi:hypothetical protein
MMEMLCYMKTLNTKGNTQFFIKYSAKNQIVYRTSAEISARLPWRQLRVYNREAERGKSANIQNVRTVKIFLFSASCTVKKVHRS